MPSSASSTLIKVSHSAPGNPKGRHLVASVDIDAGKCVLQEEAYAWVLNNDNIEQRCHCCSSVPPPAGAALSRCSGCHVVYYIDKTHQQRAWKAGHREECPVLTAARIQIGKKGDTSEAKSPPPLPPTIFRLALQVILKAYKAGELHLMARTNDHESDNTDLLHASEGLCGFSGVLSLVTHWKDKKESNSTVGDNTKSATSCSSQEPTPATSTATSTSSPTISNNDKIEFAQLAAWLYSLLQSTHPVVSEILTPRQIALLLARLSFNAHSSDDELRAYGLGIYPLTAMANHSCEPNCVQTFGKNGRVALRTVTRVCAGEELTIAYVELAAVRWERRNQLLNSHCFDIDATETGNEDSRSGGAGEKKEEEESKKIPEPRILRDQYDNVIHHYHHRNRTSPPWKHDPRDIQLTSVERKDLQSLNILDKKEGTERSFIESTDGDLCGAWGQIIEKKKRLDSFAVHGLLDEDEKEVVEEEKKEEMYIEVHTWSNGGGNDVLANGALDSFVLAYSEALYTLKESSNTLENRPEKLKLALKTLVTPSSMQGAVVLGSRHILRLRLLAGLLHALIESGDQWSDALCVARELLPLYEYVYSCPKWPSRALHVATLAKLEDFVGDMALARTYARRALSMLEGIVEPGSLACKEMERLLYNA